mgnify:CR=1 FL=1
MEKEGLDDYETDVMEAIDEFKADFRTKTRNLQSLLTIKDLELMLNELMLKTNKVYLDMTSDMLSAIDEQEVISSKK